MYLYAPAVMCQLSSYVAENSSRKDLDITSAVVQEHSTVGKHNGVSEKVNTNTIHIFERTVNDDNVYAEVTKILYLATHCQKKNRTLSAVRFTF